LAVQPWRELRDRSRARCRWRIHRTVRTKNMKGDNHGRTVSTLHLEKTMKETNGEDITEQSRPVGYSRRDFVVSAATAVASVGAANLLNLQPAQGANAINSVTTGNGPYPTEGMAAYSPTGPHKLMQFQRRALGPKDVAIRIHYCGVCHSDIHTIREDWGKIQYPQIVGHELAGEVVVSVQVSASSQSAPALVLVRW
jgi:Alcohol dehydrogenase GroES-like domain